MSWTHNYSFQTPEELEKLLGVDIDSSIVELRAAYKRQLMKYPERSKDLCLACKLASDGFYKSAFKAFGNLISIEEAGYFDDELQPGDLDDLSSPYWFTTPLNKITDNIDKLKSLDNSRPLIVLLSTGGFAPLHEGHIKMMEIARGILTGKGYNVVGGFLSPSHDIYVLNKSESIKSFTAPRRVQLLRQALKDSDWLTVDAWEALYTPRPISFTDVIVRLQNYLNSNIPEHLIKVAYVFGSDNAYFYRAFYDDGVSVCVLRPSHEGKLESACREAKSASNKKIFFSNIDCGQITQDISSRTLRETENNAIISKPLGCAPNGYYYIRNDTDWATTSWKDKCDPNALAAANDEFFKGLEKIFRDTLSKGLDVKPLDVEKQKAFIAALSKHNPIINLDIVTADSQTALGFSRLFHIADAQFEMSGITSRLSAPHNHIEISKLQPGSYYLVDDDIITGATADAVENILPNSIKIISRVSLCNMESGGDNQPLGTYDVIDARDFLMGSRASGLVVKLFNGAIVRVPYFPPFVSLVSRASVLPENELLVARKLVDLNRKFHIVLGVDINLSDTEIDFQLFMKYCGIPEKSRLLDILDWYEGRLI